MTDILIILSIVLTEIILSIDNSIVISTLVKDLPPNKQKRALTYGILGAYLFRGAALFFTSVIIQLSWLKFVGGLYLIYQSIKSIFFSKKSNDKVINYSSFWKTVLMIEFMDIVFSIDNVFSAVAFTDKFWVICLGVGVGILSVRWATTHLIKWIHKYPKLEKSALYILLLLGCKLSLSVFFNELNAEYVDILISITTFLILIFPIAQSYLIKKNEN